MWIYATEKVMHCCSMRAIQPLLYMYSDTYINFATSFDNFIPTYHSLHVCSCQTLLCVKLAACRVPLAIYVCKAGTYDYVWSLELLQTVLDYPNLYCRYLCINQLVVWV